ncbi:FRG domain-containing protein [Lentilactobacillus buchneri]|nr:FRG domain-containing protein [Lentilactobacillus buchneri]
MIEVKTRIFLILFLVIRNENYLKNEDKLINDFITKYPELFGDCKNNFDCLALMQHHQLPTRLLDLTSNPLVALYFAVERSDGSTNKNTSSIVKSSATLRIYS